MTDNLPDKWQDVLNRLTSRCDKKTFKRLLSEHDCCKMVKYCLEDHNVRTRLTSWMEQYIDKFVVQKSVTKGKSYRIKGNDRFKVRDYTGSLHFYTKSVCHTPYYDYEEFSLAVANRSAALFHLRRYEDCLVDIDCALEGGYPDHLRYKLLLRKGKVHLINNNSLEAMIALKEAEDSIPDGTKDSVRTELQEARRAAITNFISSEEQNSDDDSLPVPKNGESKELKYASAALSLKENSEKGRHIVANADIKKGDVLFVEKPYAFVVIPGPSEIVCHQCCTPVYANLPCETCVSAVYCDRSCRNEAWEKYHKWECNGLELFYALGIAHLGLRLTLVSTTTPHDDRYDQVMSLMSHIEDMKLEDVYQYCLTATLLSLYLQKHSNFFEENKNESISEVGGKIMFHICQLICNGHAITKVLPCPPPKWTAPDRGTIETCKQEWVATAIFPSASMMNHSCDPNIINSFCKEYLIVQAIRDIPCGDEVFNCYGPYYRRMDTTERKEVLKKQYFFDCPCLPCQKKGNDDFLAQFSALLCFKCCGPLLPTELLHGVCLNCGGLQPTLKLIEQMAATGRLYDEGFTKLENNQISEAVEIFKKVLEELSRILYRHNAQIRKCRDNIAKCYALMENFNKSASYLIENLKSVEEQFGEDSIEVANELQKLTDLLISDLKNSKLDKETYRKRLETAQYYVDKALEICKVHYGYWNDTYKQILKKDLILEVCGLETDDSE